MLAHGFVHCSGSKTASTPTGAQETILQSKKKQATSTGKVLQHCTVLDGLDTLCVCMCVCTHACVCVVAECVSTVYLQLGCVSESQ